LIRGGYRFSEKIMLQQEAGADYGAVLQHLEVFEV
jgi:hypothetical protein